MDNPQSVLKGVFLSSGLEFENMAKSYPSLWCYAGPVD